MKFPIPLHLLCVMTMFNLFNVRKKGKVLAFISLLVLTLSACGTQSQTDATDTISFASLEKTGEMDLAYAKCFSVDYYGEYSLINIVNDGKFLLVPEGADVPGDLDEDITVLKQPLDHTYLVSTSVMDLLRQLDVLSMVTLSGSKASDWYIEEAKKAMESGEITYAGKYSTPDYELLLQSGCNIAIENSMIYHTPETKEKLEEIGIPVLVEQSSYESSPLGRLEWIKLYGLLYEKMEEADAYFANQVNDISAITTDITSDKSVAFFYVNSSGLINVRKPDDYVSKMISMAGGQYALCDVIPEEDNALSTMNMQMEDFYVAAKDADILIYNSTVDGELQSIDALLDKNSLFSDFKAVSKKQVYTTGKNFFQESTGIAEFIMDMYHVLQEDGSDLTYLKKVE